jgi:hypothetical protein
LLCSLLTSVIICACGFLWCFCWLPCGSRLTSAWLVLCVSCSSLTPLHLIQAEIACHRGGV